MAKRPLKKVSCIKCGFEFGNPMPYSDFNKWQCKKCSAEKKQEVETVDVKQCRRCKQLKPYSEYTIRNHNICRECVKQYDKRH